MIAITHFDAAPDDTHFEQRAETALAALAARPGYLRGQVARSIDDVRAWVIVTEWASVGAYRRALGAFEVRIGAHGLLAQARDIASAFEPLLTIGADGQLLRSASDRRTDETGARAE